MCEGVCVCECVCVCDGVCVSRCVRVKVKRLDVAGAVIGTERTPAPTQCGSPSITAQCEPVGMLE